MLTLNFKNIKLNFLIFLKIRLLVCLVAIDEAKKEKSGTVLPDNVVSSKLRILKILIFYYVVILVFWLFENFF